MLSAVARTNKVNTNVHDASSIFRDVYIHINYVDCGTAVTNDISVAGYRVPKSDVIENEICEIMGFVKLF